MAGRPRASLDPVAQAKNRYEAAKKRHRRNPDVTGAEEVTRLWHEFKAIRDAAKGGVKLPSGVMPKLVLPEEPLKDARVFVAATHDAEHAGRLEVLLMIELGLPHGADLDFDEQEEREWLVRHPDLAARIQGWFARWGLADVFGRWAVGQERDAS